MPATTDTTHSQNFEDTIKVVVGPARKEQRFTIHKNLICASSKFFQAACSKRWAEGRAKEVHLDEVKTETFRAYIVWVYAGNITANKSKQSDPEEAALDEFAETVDLYLLGEYLATPRCGLWSRTAKSGSFNSCPSSSTTSGSPLSLTRCCGK